MPRLDGLLRRIEAMSVSGVERHWALLPPELARKARAHVERVGDGILTLMATSDSLRMNRVTGLGHRGAATEEMIDRVVDRYRTARLKRFSVMLGQGPQAEEIAAWLVTRKFEPRGGHALLIRSCRRPVPRVASGLRVVRARAEHRAAIVRILGESFWLPASRRGWALASAADPAYRHFIALAGTVPAGVGALRAERGLAWLGGGATLTRWRRRGVHSSLIAARLRCAARLGCTWAWSETGLPVPGRPDISRRNLLRLGFMAVGTRRSFLWQARS